jgi:predicted RND superfamily exporter protein
MLSMVYDLYFRGSSAPPEERKLTVPDLFGFVSEKILSNPLFSSLIPADLRDAAAGAGDLLRSNMSMLKTARYSRMVIYSTLPVESEQTSAFMTMLKNTRKNLEGEYFLIGNSAMSDEMQQSFSGELWTVTLLTAAAIFLIVLITSRSFVVPAVLVLIVQCGVFITVTLVGWQGYQIYFLALLMVECILMGATIDYGILFTNCYRESRRTLSSPDALSDAYQRSVHSIMTSGLIIVVITGIFGYTYPDPTIAEICRTISVGALSAILLILLILPGLLAAVDRLIIRRRKHS